jgi:magnesium chelatase family protein
VPRTFASDVLGQYNASAGGSYRIVRATMKQLQMRGLAYRRTLELARTIAGLAGSDRIETGHLAAAIQYRPRRQS